MARPRLSKTITLDLIRDIRPATGVKRASDKKCPGLLVAVTARGTATFFVRYWNRQLKRQEEEWLGRFHPDTFSIDMARTMARSFQARAGAGEDVKKAERRKKAQACSSAKTVAQLIDDYVAWIKEEITEQNGFTHPRVKNWRGHRGFLERFLKPRFAQVPAEEVTKADIQALLDDIRHGRAGPYAATEANALAARDKFSALFTYAGFTVNPCKGLRKIGRKGEKTRVLNLEEIRILWHGLDRKDLPFPRSVALALKFQLCTMLRSIEFRTAEVSELRHLDTRFAHLRVPLNRVKKRRVILQPLSTLAQEVLAEALNEPGHNPDLIFKTVTGVRLADHALSQALNGYSRKGRGHGILNRIGRHTTRIDGRTKEPYVVRIAGLCEILGIAKFTPHDLRRTAASLANELRKVGGFGKADIAACLDHSGKGESEDMVSPVTGIYIRQGVVPWSQDLEDKRIVLETLGQALREIVGQRPPKLLTAIGVDLPPLLLPPLPPELEKLVA